MPYAILILTFMAALLLGQPAHAVCTGEECWVRKSVRSSCNWWENCYHTYTHTHYYAPASYSDWDRDRIRQQLRVYNWHRRQRYQRHYVNYGRRDWRDHERHDHNEGRYCLNLVKAIGDERQSVDKAKDAAARAWMGTVRFPNGEKWIEIDNARDVRFTCSRSSVNDTVLGKTQEAIGIVHSRCEIQAIPCRAPLERERP